MMLVFSHDRSCRHLNIAPPRPESLDRRVENHCPLSAWDRGWRYRGRSMPSSLCLPNLHELLMAMGLEDVACGGAKRNQHSPFDLDASLNGSAACDDSGHQQVTLQVVSKLEPLYADFHKTPLAIEADRPIIPLPNVKPDDITALVLGFA